MKSYALKLFSGIIIFLAVGTSAQQISPLLVGTNLWYNDPGEQVWNLTRECGVKTIRIGGHAYDKNLPPEEILLEWVRKIQAIGAEPILQVSQYQSADAAAALVRFLNVEKHEGVAPVKYWNIGNEPWLQAGRPPLSTMGDFVEGYFKPIAAAMKAVDPAIKIYGPDFCDYFDEPIDDLFGGKNDISGKIPGKDYYYCDGLSWHRYPQGDGDPAVEGAGDFLERIVKSNAKTDQVNAQHNRTGDHALIWGIGEYNSKGGPEVHTWGNGQMFGAVLGWCMEYEASYAASWSMFEHGGDRKGSDFSLIDGAHMIPRASYRHMEFVAKYFTGAFLKGTASHDDFLVYGAQDGDQTSVMIMNRGFGDPAEYTLFLRDTVLSGPGLTMVVQGKSAEVYHDIIEPRTTQVFVFKGDSLTKINYSSDDFEKELSPVYSKKEIMQTRTKPIRPVTPREFPEDGRYVNLESFYNFSLGEEIHGKPGNTIPAPSGLNDFNGVTFDARGIIQLASKVSFEMSHIHYPREIIGIPVNHLADSLCFLQSSAWESTAGTEVVRIVVNYADDQKETITIRSRIEVEDWWFHMENSVFPPEAELAWEGSNTRVADLGFVLKLYRYTWTNPRPGVEIKSLDLISAMNETGYMLYALTCL